MPSQAAHNRAGHREAPDSRRGSRYAASPPPAAPPPMESASMFNLRTCRPVHVYMQLQPASTAVDTHPM